jgi:hypothetical protein
VNFLIARGGSTEYFEASMTYQTIEAFIAVSYEEPKPFKFVTINAGSIVTVKGEVRGSGLVSLLHDGQIVAAFRQDIETKAEIVEHSLVDEESK